MDDLRPRRGFGRLVLRAFAIASALAFLTLVIVQATEFYAPPPQGEKPTPAHYFLSAPTKAAPVLHPSLRREAETEAATRNLLMGETKAGPLVQPGPIWIPAPRAVQRQGTTPRQRR